MYQDAPIRNCAAPDGQTGCPQQWGNLKASYVEGVRQCGTCKRNVYLCRTDRDVALYSALNYCFAIGTAVTNVDRHQAPGTPAHAGSASPHMPERRAAVTIDLPPRFLGRLPELPRERRSVRRERS